MCRNFKGEVGQNVDRRPLQFKIQLRGYCIILLRVSFDRHVVVINNSAICRFSVLIVLLAHVIGSLCKPTAETGAKRCDTGQNINR